MSDNLNDPKIKKLIETLDSKIPRENATVKLVQYGGGPDESQIIANKAGYLRLGVELLKAAFAKQSDDSKDPNDIETSIDYLITDDSDISFDWFKRTEKIDEEIYKPSIADKIIPTGIILLIVLGIVCAIIGVVTVVGWLT